MSHVSTHNFGHCSIEIQSVNSSTLLVPCKTPFRNHSGGLTLSGFSKQSFLTWCGDYAPVAQSTWLLAIMHFRHRFVKLGMNPEVRGITCMVQVYRCDTYVYHVHGYRICIYPSKPNPIPFEGSAHSPEANLQCHFNTSALATPCACQ